MKIKIVFLSMLLKLSLSVVLVAQTSDFDKYKTAYNYLNTIVKSNYPNAKTLAKNCSECCVKGAKLKFKSDLQVASKFIENNRGFPLMDLVDKKYRFSNDCIRAIRMGTRDCELSNQVQDSLKTFWKDYKMKERDEISKTIEELLSKRKNGYQVFFSDVYKNTIAAELMNFCLPYNETTWMGHSTSFYFVFSDKGEIKEVYSGTSIHYN